MRANKNSTHLRFGLSLHPPSNHLLRPLNPALNRSLPNLFTHLGTSPARQRRFRTQRNTSLALSRQPSRPRTECLSTRSRSSEQFPRPRKPRVLLKHLSQRCTQGTQANYPPTRRLRLPQATRRPIGAHKNCSGRRRANAVFGPFPDL